MNTVALPDIFDVHRVSKKRPTFGLL